MKLPETSTGTDNLLSFGGMNKRLISECNDWRVENGQKTEGKKKDPFILLFLEGAESKSEDTTSKIYWRRDLIYFR